MQSVAQSLGKAWRDDYETSLVFRSIFRGSNGSTTFSDTAPSPSSLTAYNSAAISTAQSKYGSSSLSVPSSGSTSYVKASYKSGFDFASSDFCFELWMYPSTLPSAGVIIGLQNGGGFAPWTLYHNSSGVLTLYLSHNNSSWSGYTSLTGGTLTTGSWHHIAGTRSGSDFRLFLNGSQIGSTYTSVLALGSASSLDLIIGSRYDLYPINGYIDSIRLYKGVAKYTGSFTPGQFFQ